MPQKLDFRLVLAMFIVGIVWGTTYLGIAIAVETIPPWYSTAMRNSLAALIVLGMLLYKNKLRWIGRKSFFEQSILSVFMLVFANGFTTIAEQTLPSGLTSIISSVNPVVVFILGLIFQLQKPSYTKIVGVVFGFSGVLFIFKEGLSDVLNPNYKVGVLFLCTAIFSWSIGTIYSKKLNLQSDDLLLNLFYQFSIAALIQWVLSLIVYPHSNIQQWSLKSITAIIYLAVFGSVITLFSFQYALKRVSPIQVSILSYVNTVIAVFLGWFIKDEVVKSDFIVAVLLIIFGVYMINYTKKSR